MAARYAARKNMWHQFMFMNSIQVCILQTPAAYAIHLRSPYISPVWMSSAFLSRMRTFLMECHWKRQSWCGPCTRLVSLSSELLDLVLTTGLQPTNPKLTSCALTSFSLSLRNCRPLWRPKKVPMRVSWWCRWWWWPWAARKSFATFLASLQKKSTQTSKHFPIRSSSCKCHHYSVIESSKASNRSRVISKSKFTFSGCLIWTTLKPCGFSKLM